MAEPIPPPAGSCLPRNPNAMSYSALLYVFCGYSRVVTTTTVISGGCENKTITPPPVSDPAVVVSGPTFRFRLRFGINFATRQFDCLNLNEYTTKWNFFQNNTLKAGAERLNWKRTTEAFRFATCPPPCKGKPPTSAKVTTTITKESIATPVVVNTQAGSSDAICQISRRN